MTKRDKAGEHPMRQAEDAALNTYREWHILLVLRLKELGVRKPVTSEGETEKEKKS
jgi:hypothetical protein